MNYEISYTTIHT